ncbi:MAG: hypothetical protein O3A53_10425 [Acidobacteria bacterium]|nr:hypothetical protein [Acidobacteriota bacterium]MDA1235204.1 hypothetical protein [Acidobacteriota bacterium]
MPSPLYIKLLATTGPYVDAKKAEEVIARQLAKCGATADTFAATHLEAIKLLICGSLGLYVPDVGKREELVGKLKSLA